MPIETTIPALAGDIRLKIDWMTLANFCFVCKYDFFQMVSFYLLVELIRSLAKYWFEIAALINTLGWNKPL